MPETQHSEVNRYFQTLFHVGTFAGLNDRDLLERFTNRSGGARELAFAAIVERYGPMVLRVCSQVLSHREDAEDAFQATFLVLAQKATSLRRPEAIGPYLHGIALRVAACARAAEARRSRHEQRCAKMKSVAHHATEPDDLNRVVHEEIDRLPEPLRSAVVLCDLEGITSVAASVRLGCPHGTVMSRLAEARRRLRFRLARRGLAPASGTITFLLARQGRGYAADLAPALVKKASYAAISFTTNSAELGGAAEVSASAAALAQRVLTMFLITRMKAVASALAAIGLLSLGAVLFAQGPGMRGAKGPMELTAAGPGGTLPRRENRPEATAQPDLPTPSELASKWVRIATDPIAPKMVFAVDTDEKKRAITLFEELNLPRQPNRTRQYSEVTEFSLARGQAFGADGQPIAEADIWQRLPRTQDDPPALVLLARDQRALAPRFRSILRPGTILLIGEATYRGTFSQ